MAGTVDLTKGKPLKLIIKFTIPILFSTFLQQMYNLVDAIIVGQKLDPNFFGAISASNALMNLMLSVMIGLGTGTAVVIGQLFAAQKMNALKRSVSTTVMFMLIPTIIISVLGFVFTKQLLIIMKISPAYLESASQYMQIIFIGLIPTMLYNLYSGLLRGVGNSKAPLFILLFTTVLNIFLDLFLIESLGIKGVAIATLISNILSVVLCMVYIRFKVKDIHIGFKQWIFDKEILKKILKASIPAVLQQFAITFSILILQIIVSSYDAGTNQVLHLSGYGVGSRISDLVSIPIMSVGVALSSYAAQNKGINDIARIRQGYRQGMLIMLILVLFTGIPTLLFADKFIGLILRIDSSASSAKVLEVAKNLIFALVPFHIFLGLQFGTSSLLRGSGVLKLPLIITLFAMVLRTVLAYVLSLTLHNYIFAFYAFPFSWFINSVLVLIIYKGKAWEKKQLINDII